MQKIILASTSPYRRQLLEKLDLPFQVDTPDYEEVRISEEPPQAMAIRLAKGKANSLAAKYPEHLIIGSDQVACLPPDTIFSKPGDLTTASSQLRACSEKTVVFYTGLCLLNSKTGTAQTDVEEFRVHFRKLSPQQIERYLQKEQPFDCAGSFKVEGLGISLFRALEGRDPNALVGLPLILLTDFLMNEGVELP